MLKLGEKGAILQRDKKTYAVAPHIPCGVVTPELLRRIADVSDKYNAQAIKITGAARIAIIGIQEEDVDQVWQEFRLDKGAAVGSGAEYPFMPWNHLLQTGQARCAGHGHGTRQALSCQGVARQIQNGGIWMPSELL